MMSSPLMVSPGRCMGEMRGAAQRQLDHERGMRDALARALR